MKCYFAHMIKTGGTSVRNFLFKHFKEKCYNEYSLVNNSFLSIDDIYDIESSYNYDYYSNHRLSFCSTKLSKVKTLSIVRDPVDRFISTFFFFKNILSVNYHYKSLEEAIFQQLIKKNVKLKNINQNYFLSEGNGFDYITKRLEENCILIPYENINIIPSFFGINDILPRENPSNAPEVDEKIRSKIRLMCQDDDYLHKWTLDNFNPNNIKL